MASERSYVSDFSEFFTRDRLEWYRELSEQFRLWCGNWPEDLLWHPKAQEWSLDTLSLREFEAEDSDPDDLIISIEFPNSPTTTAASFPFLRCWASGEDLEYLDEEWFDSEVLIPGVEPLVFGALFAALNYLSYRWEADGKAVRLPRVGIGRVVQILPTLRRLLHRKHYLERRMEYMKGDHLSKAQLQEIWIEIGEEAGLIPDRQGQTSANLDDHHLKDLHEEGMELVAKFREGAPESDYGEVAKLKLTYPEDFPQLTVLNEALTDPSRDWAKKVLKDRLERHASELDLDYWVYRLRFPMLRREEVRALLAEPTKNPKLLVRDFLAKRVGLSPNTLANRGI